MLQIGEPVFDRNQELLLKGFKNKYIYTYFINKSLSPFGATLNNKKLTEAMEMIDFVINLAKILPSMQEHHEKQYNPMKFADLQKKFPSLPLQEIINIMFNPLSVQQDEVIIVSFPKYLSNLEILLSKTSKR